MAVDVKKIYHIIKINFSTLDKFRMYLLQKTYKRASFSNPICTEKNKDRYSTRIPILLLNGVFVKYYLHMTGFDCLLWHICQLKAFAIIIRNNSERTIDGMPVLWQTPDNANVIHVNIDMLVAACKCIRANMSNGFWNLNVNEIVAI